MPKLSRISGEEAIRKLEKLGFQQVRQRGSHVVLKRKTPEGDIGCVVPLHKELKRDRGKPVVRECKDNR
jgi:predicted RNA binding protein YcfA (HicA-like mRNA interferase family)